MLSIYAPLALFAMPLLFVIPWVVDQVTKKRSHQLSEELNILSERGSEQVLKIIQEQSSIRFANQIDIELAVLNKINQEVTSKEPTRNFLERIKGNVIGVLFAFMEF